MPQNFLVVGASNLSTAVDANSMQFYRWSGSLSETTLGPPTVIYQNRSSSARPEKRLIC